MSAVPIRLAATNGRFSGVVNQPAEAGVLYGVAGLLAVYVWRNRQVLLAAVLIVLAIGGTLTVSKVFLLGGLPLILAYWFIMLPSGRHMRLKALALLAAIGVLLYFTLRDWSGFTFLARLFLPPKNSGTGLSSVIDLYSAGRFTEGSGLQQLINQVLTVSPVSGVGASGWQTAYDNGWVEALVTAGLLGVVAYTITLFLVFLTAWRIQEKGLRLFGISFAIFLIGASLGIPALTTNRVSTIVWMIISLMALMALPRVKRLFQIRRSGRPAEPTESRRSPFSRQNPAQPDIGVASKLKM